MLASPPQGRWTDDQLRIIGVAQETIPVFKQEQQSLRDFAAENPTYYTRDLDGDAMPHLESRSADGSHHVLKKTVHCRFQLLMQCSILSHDSHHDLKTTVITI